MTTDIRVDDLVYWVEDQPDDRFEVRHFARVTKVEGQNISIEYGDTRHPTREVFPAYRLNIYRPGGQSSG